MNDERKMFKRGLAKLPNARKPSGTKRVEFDETAAMLLRIFRGERVVAIFGICLCCQDTLTNLMFPSNAPIRKRGMIAEA